jgi:hypothetical protein
VCAQGISTGEGRPLPSGRHSLKCLYASLLLHAPLYVRLLQSICCQQVL